jgi:3-hydroxyisobutyrate dehydrogenase
MALTKGVNEETGTMRIGWVGLGEIGTEMVKRLCSAGHPVVAYGRGAGLEAATAAGATILSDYAGLAAGCEMLVLCVFNDAQLREVLFEGGALDAMPSGSIVAIHTTGSPELSQEIARRAPAGVAVLEACFSGGPADVAAGRLTLLVGGDEATLEQARPALCAYAANIFLVGPVGHGQKLKLLNNLLFATNLMNAAEIVRLALAQGFTKETAATVIQASSGASYAMNLLKSPAPLDQMLAAVRHYMEKDVATAAAAATELGLDISAFAPSITYYQPTKST